jgi:Bacterial regulatory helix-turn-helix protein, lysR family
LPIKLSQLHNFAAVVEAGAVRQAAKALNLSQSSVTKSIQQLESELGVVLLHRGAHGVAAANCGPKARRPADANSFAIYSGNAPNTYTARMTSPGRNPICSNHFLKISRAWPLR